MNTKTVRVCSFESRRQNEMRTLIEKFGGVPSVAPSMKEVPLQENTHLLEFVEQLQAGQISVVLFMTGVGAKALFDAVASLADWDRFQNLLNQQTIIVRGPKPVPVLKEAGIHIDFRAPEPNTWREVLGLIDEQQILLHGITIAVQEYGKPNEQFYEELRHRGAEVYPVPVYCWDFPDDLAPLQAVIREAVENPFDLVMFTSAQQVENVLAVCESLGLKDQWLKSLEKSLLISIGPTCSERMLESGLRVDLEPSHPKMAHMVREALAACQSSSSPLGN